MLKRREGLRKILTSINYYTGPPFCQSANKGICIQKDTVVVTFLQIIFLQKISFAGFQDLKVYITAKSMDYLKIFYREDGWLLMACYLHIQNIVDIRQPKKERWEKFSKKSH